MTARTMLIGLPGIAVWSVAIYFGVTQGLDFFKNLKFDITAPDDSRSERGIHAYGDLFKQKEAEYPFSHGVLIVATDPSRLSVWSPAVANLTSRVIDGTLGVCPTLPAGEHGLCWWRQAAGVFVPRDASQLDQRLSDYVSPDNRTATLIVISTNEGFGAAGNAGQRAAWAALQQVITAWLDEAGPDGRPHRASFTVGSTHEQMLLDDAQKDVIRDFELGDAVTLPIALLVLGLAVGPMGALALITLPATILGALYALNQLAVGAWLCESRNGDGSCATPVVAFPNFAPAIFLNMMIAISLDYTLFLLSRFREELELGRPVPRAVGITMRQTGRVVLVSGLTLGFCFVGLSFCYIGVVSALGYGGAACCAVAILVHLTLLPSLLLLLGPCCGAMLRCRWRCSFLGARRRSLPKEAARALTTPLRHRGAASSSADDERRSSLLLSPLAGGGAAAPFWVRLGLFCRDHRLGIIGLLLLLLLPCAYLTTKLRASTTQALLTPRSSPALKTMASIPEHGISAGVLKPVLVVVNNRVGSAAPRLGCRDDDFDAGQLVAAMSGGAIVAADVTCAKLEDALSICNASLAPTVHGHSIAPLAQTFCPGTCPGYCNVPPGRNVSVLTPRLFELTHSFRSELVHTLGLPPEQIRDVAAMPANATASLTAAEATAQLAAAAEPNASASSLAYRAAFDRLTNFNQTAAPQLILATACGVTFVMSGLAFRSLLIPIRLLLTILVTLVVVSGGAVLVYQELMGLDGLYWVVPISCSCLIVGLSLDYDVFLISRVFEERLRGYTTEASILRAMERQSTTITTAGIIMTVAFTSLLFSSTYILNQWGFLLVTAALVDTLVVRAVLVPALMFCAVEANWWPCSRCLPRATLDYNDVPTDYPSEYPSGLTPSGVSRTPGDTPSGRDPLATPPRRRSWVTEEESTGKATPTRGSCN